MTHPPAQTNWRPTKKWLAGFITATVLFVFDVVNGGLTRDVLVQYLPEASILAAFYLKTDG